MTTETTFKTSVTFKDKKRNRVKADIEIKDGRFSMCGDYDGGLGQVFDQVSPATDAQKSLIELWNKWHLNDMHAGTPEQESALENCESKDYDARRQHLADHDLLYVPFDDPKENIGRTVIIRADGDNFDGLKVKIVDVHSQDRYECVTAENDLPVGKVHGSKLEGLGYEYGTKWLKVDLPEDFEDELQDILDEIESENNESPFSESDIDYDGEDGLVTWDTILEAHGNDEDDANKACAICLMLDGSIETLLNDIEVDGTRVCIEGVDYLCGSDSEMNDEWDEDLDRYIENCVLPELPENMRNYFDEEAWKRDARMDGRAHSLNCYDGGEMSQDFGNTTFYAYRQ